MSTLAQQIEALRAVLPKLGGSRSFAENLIAGFERYGSLTDKQLPWVRKLIDRAVSAGADAGGQSEQRKVGDLNGILALFGRAQKHLKRPAVELGVPGHPDRAIRVNVAGDRAKVPGSLTVLSAEKFETGREFPERKWFGRILREGFFQCARELDDEPTYREAVIARLRAFAADPSKVGGEDGRLHGRCCFCRIALTDERSTAVGYGKKCAQNFGLEWGKRPAEFAGEAVEKQMHLLEAAGDRAETTRDEANKHAARQAMEDATDGTEDYNNLARREAARDHYGQPLVNRIKW